MPGELDRIFGMVNHSYFLGKQVTLFNLVMEQLEKEAQSYFVPGQAPAEHAVFFNRFTTIWMDLISRRRYFEAIQLWEVAIGFAYRWEQKNKPHLIHKGTPYYFMGVTAILNNELETGFLLMHQAFEEDKRLSGAPRPPSPACAFVTLDYEKQEQFFRQKVEELSNYLSSLIDQYSTNRNGSLTLKQFKSKFLECADLTDEVFLFVYVLFRLRKLLLETGEQLKMNVLSSIIHARILFDMCLVLDKAVEEKNPEKATGKRLYLSKEIVFLSQKTSLSINKKTIEDLNKSYKKDFAKTIEDIITSNYPLSSDIERDLALAHGIRNFVAHTVEDQKVLYKNMPELSQRLLNALFFAIEKLY